jgi:hypothetical protein
MHALDLDPTHAPVSVIGEKDLRRQIDLAVSRALVDPEYATLLLANPTVVLNDHTCPPQQYLSLLSIQAGDLVDFARQAWALFWMSDSFRFDSTANPRNLAPEEHRQLAVLAIP